jgi:hypothetical protein
MGPAIPSLPSERADRLRVDQGEDVLVEVGIDVDLLDRAATRRIRQPGLDLGADVLDPGVARQR